MLKQKQHSTPCSLFVLEGEKMTVLIVNVERYMIKYMKKIKAMETG